MTENVSHDFLIDDRHFSVEILPESGVYWIEVWEHVIGLNSQCLYAREYKTHDEAEAAMFAILSDPVAYV